MCFSCSFHPKLQCLSHQIPSDPIGMTKNLMTTAYYASQMKRDIQPADTDLVRRGIVKDRPTHRLDTMIARTGMHAARSPLITQIQTVPDKIPEASGWSQRNPRPSWEDVYDTAMFMKFRDKGAREE